MDQQLGMFRLDLGLYIQPVTDMLSERNTHRQDQRTPEIGFMWRWFNYKTF